MLQIEKKEYLLKLQRKTDGYNKHTVHIISNSAVKREFIPLMESTV